MLRFAANLLLCALSCGAAAAQLPSFRRPPIPDYREATFAGMADCKADPSFQYCSRGDGKLYIILVDGQLRVLRPAFSSKPILTLIQALVAPENRPSLVLQDRNVLAHVMLDGDVQVHFHGSGVEVRVLAQSSRGARYIASHYSMAVSRRGPYGHRTPGPY